MRIIHFVNQNYKITNGIKSVICSLIPFQIELGHTVKVYNLFHNDQLISPDEICIPTIRVFKKELQCFKPDLVVFHGGYEIKYYFFAYYLRCHNIPYVVVPHGGTSIFNLSKKRIAKTIVNKLFTKSFILKASGVIFLNEKEHENSIFSKYIKKYRIIPNGIYIQQINESDKTIDDTVHFIYLSRIDIKYKGLDILLEAINNLHHNHPELLFDFHFYGGRFNISSVDEFKKMLCAAKSPVYYHGEVFGDEKDNAYRYSNIYVLTSLSEGMPLTVLEALSFGNPCIVSPQTNMGDLILENSAGWVAQTNVTSIENALYRAIVDYNNNRTHFIKNAQNAVKDFDWREIARCSISAYESLIN